jgi:hypothetical protein
VFESGGGRNRESDERTRTRRENEHMTKGEGGWPDVVSIGDGTECRRRRVLGGLD